MRKVSNVREQLKADEGTVPYAYTDSLGFWTIGTGILIDRKKGGALLPEEMDFILDNRIKINANTLTTKINWFSRLDTARQGVLINMSFQLGMDGLLKFVNTLKMIETGDYAGASVGMLNSLWAKQTPERANRLSKQMRTGIWQ